MWLFNISLYFFCVNLLLEILWIYTLIVWLTEPLVSRKSGHNPLSLDFMFFWQHQQASTGQRITLNLPDKALFYLSNFVFLMLSTSNSTSTIGLSYNFCLPICYASQCFICIMLFIPFPLSYDYSLSFKTCRKPALICLDSLLLSWSTDLQLLLSMSLSSIGMWVPWGQRRCLLML